MESNINTSVINIVIYTESEKESRDFVHLLFKKRLGDADIWQEHLSETLNINAYIRWPNSIPTASPIGITDILLVSLKSGETGEHWQTIKNYVDARRGIPFKFLTSNTNLSAEAKSLDSEYLPLSELTSSGMGEKLVKSALDLEATLRNVFNKIDANKNGFIDNVEIMNASLELNHAINAEEAHEIATTLSTDGKISFMKFKQWWVMGRTDFSSFRKLVGIELVVNKFVQQSSQTFNSYLEKCQKEGQDFSSTTPSFTSQVNIGAEKEFVHGLSINAHLTAGNDFNTIATSLPSYIMESPASFGLELRLKDSKDGTSVIDILTGIKEMAVGMVPQIQKLIESGLTINFRHVGTSVFVDCSYGGSFGDQISGLLSMFNLSSLNFGGSSDFHVVSKLSPVDLLEHTADQIVESLSNIKISGKGEYSQLNTLFSFFVNTMSAMNIHKINKSIKPITYAFRLAGIIRKLDFTFNYDPVVLQDLAKTVISEWMHDDSIEATEAATVAQTKYQKITETWSLALQPQINATVEQFSQMGLMFLEPYKAGILGLDLDNISIYTCCPILRLHLKLHLYVRGVSQFAETLLANI